MCLSWLCNLICRSGANVDVDILVISAGAAIKSTIQFTWPTSLCRFHIGVSPRVTIRLCASTDTSAGGYRIRRYGTSTQLPKFQLVARPSWVEINHGSRKFRCRRSVQHVSPVIFAFLMTESRLKISSRLIPSAISSLKFVNKSTFNRLSLILDHSLFFLHSFHQLHRTNC